MKPALPARPHLRLHHPTTRRTAHWADAFLDTVSSRGFLLGTAAFAIWNAAWLALQLTLV